MYRTVFLCLALFMRSTYAFFPNNWWYSSTNQQTECDEAQTHNQWGWFPPPSCKTHINKLQVLDDLKDNDTDSDGFLTITEAFTALQKADPSLELTTGVSRCDFVQFITKRYGVTKEVASHVFDTINTSGDLVIDQDDFTDATLNTYDKNNDGKISVCEVYQGFVKAAEAAGEIVARKDRKLKESSIYNKPTYWRPWKHW